MKGYVFTKRTRSKNITVDDMFDDDDDALWRQKAERLQARRWRKIKHQLV